MDFGYIDIDNSINKLQNAIFLSENKSGDKIELKIDDAKMILDILKDYNCYLTD